MGIQGNPWVFSMVFHRILQSHLWIPWSPSRQDEELDGWGGAEAGVPTWWKIFLVRWSKFHHDHIFHQIIIESWIPHDIPWKNIIFRWLNQPSISSQEMIIDIPFPLICRYGGVQKMGYPLKTLDVFFFRENPSYKWMIFEIFWGYPYDLGNPHIPWHPHLFPSSTMARNQPGSSLSVARSNKTSIGVAAMIVIPKKTEKRGFHHFLIG